MNSTRILVNIAVFAVLGVILTVWAFQNVIKFDFIEHPYRVTVEFESSPGLHPNFEVDYLGTKIGKIDSVRLRDRKVQVRLDIDKGVRIPREVTAAAARKSAVGEPVVELTPVPGAADGPPMRTDGTAVIPVARTSVPPDYGDLFGSVNKAISAIDPGDARVLTHELAVGWNGRADSLRQIITGADQLTSTFANNTELLDGLTRDLGKITNVLARNRGRLGEGVDDLATLLAALREVRGELTGLRDRGPGLLGRFNKLLDATGPDINCSLDTLGGFFPQLATPARLAELRRTLAISPELVRVLDNILATDQGQPVLNVALEITARTPAALEYKFPLPQPSVRPIPNCPDGRRPAVVKQKRFVGGNPGATVPRHDPSAQGPDRQVKNTADKSSNSPAGPPAWLVYVPPVLALLVLIRVMAGSVPVIARQTRYTRRRRGRR